MASLLDDDQLFQPPGGASTDLLGLGKLQITQPDPTNPDQGAALGQTYQMLMDEVARQRQISADRGLWSGGGLLEGGHPTGAGVVGAAGQAAQGIMMGTTAPGEAPGFTAYHGSPHSFDAFDTSKIGTGEGAQAYGHGLYFADAEATARGYRDRLAPATYQTETGPDSASNVWSAMHNAQIADGVHPNIAPQVATNVRNMIDEAGSIDKAVTQFDIPNDPKYGPAYQSAIDAAKRMQLASNPGHMYEVQVNADPAHFLDWDKPLSEQSQHVQDALTPQGLGLKPVGPFGPKGYYGWADEAGNRVGPLQTGAPPSYIFDPRETGMSIARGAGSWKPEVAAAKLQAAGIPGIRYLDAGSRGAGTGTSNHVIFDANTIAILRKYGIAGLMAGGGAAAAGTQSPQQ